VQSHDLKVWVVIDALQRAEFHPRLIGLTGAKEACVAAAKAYRVYFTKANQTEEDYLIDHSIIHYLIDPEGAFVGFYGKNMDANAICKSITDQVQKWKKDGKAIG
jgi:protein SCO1/2